MTGRAQRMRFSIGVETRVGPRPHQNDSYFFGDTWLALADGVGADADARTAADLAVRFYGELASSTAEGIADRMLEGPERLRDLFATRVLIQWTTVAAAILDDRDRLWLTTVGDSRLLVIRHGTIIYASNPHNEAHRPGGDAASPDARNVLTRSLGPSVVSDPDVALVSARERDVVVLMTDGVDALVTPGEVVRIVAATGGAEPAAQALIRRASASGLHDNATVLVGVVERGRGVLE